MRKFFFILILMLLCFNSTYSFGNQPDDTITTETLQKGSRVKVLVGIVEVSTAIGNADKLSVNQEALDPSDTVQNFSITLPVLLTPEGNIGIIEGSFLVGDSMWNFILETITREGRGRIRSNTFGIADDGKPISFEATSKEPYQTLKVIGNKEQLVVEFLSIGTQAEITPTINENGETVTATLDFKISEILRESDEDRNVPVPIESVRRINTTVTARPNEFIVIGGLNQEKRVEVRTGIPYLRRIPLIGILFSSKEIKVTMTKLYIVTNFSVSDGDIEYYRTLDAENAKKIPLRGLEKLR